MNQPIDILIDFETAAVNAVTNQMPQLQVLKVNLYTVVAYLHLFEYLADSFSDYKCARWCFFSGFFVVVLAWAFLGKACLGCFLVPLHVFIAFIL